MLFNLFYVFDDIIGRFIGFILEICIRFASMANACQCLLNEKSAQDRQSIIFFFNQMMKNYNFLQFHSLRIVGRHKTVRMTFIAFVQTIHCCQIESSIATVFGFGANCDSRKCNFINGS